MKRYILTLLSVFLLANVASAYTSPLHKLTSGIRDVVTGPFKFFTVTTEQMKTKDDKLLAALGGLMEGTVQSAVVPLNGVFKILTFPFVNHEYEDE
jgi:hypothetical protein